ncbi:hypothetical protein FGB62_24g00 [Gracilaria domingensis]|nr:hypothetical protein FGB62_24g00 [Gracilaria domingensis]
MPYASTKASAPPVCVFTPSTTKKKRPSTQTIYAANSAQGGNCDANVIDFGPQPLKNDACNTIDAHSTGSESFNSGMRSQPHRMVAEEIQEEEQNDKEEQPPKSFHVLHDPNDNEYPSTDSWSSFQGDDYISSSKESASDNTSLSASELQIQYTEVQMLHNKVEHKTPLNHSDMIPNIVDAGKNATEDF